MLPKVLTSWLPVSKKPRRGAVRLGIEYLEDRTMLDASLPPDIVVGRTLSSYTVAGVQNHTLDVTYTVYNETADDVTGVLLTTTLQPGVAFKTASVLPDQRGQDLAWSLGTIHGFDRADVTLTVTLPDVPPLQIDSGAHAFGTLDAGMVTNDTPAAALTTRVIPADQLASTPEANTTDPFVQEQAAKLRYDPQAIFNYLNADVGYESYTGSLRGARGTLWSAAGNSLDEASLGVALFRASGIPARYAHGTLSDPLSKQLILSMFPASFQTVGYIPAGTPTADPANDPKLLGETRDHFWVQFDSTGTGFVDADTSGLPGGGVGTAFTAATNTFTEVADSLRHKVEVKLDAETYTQLAAAFGLGDGLSTATVLDQTFNSVDLVGRPMSIGHFVAQSAAGLLLVARTTTYTPYIEIGDAAYPDSSQDETITGTQYQEVLTNFPLGNQVLTGAFLTMTLTGPGVSPETETRTLYDRIGYAARQGFVPANVSTDPNGPPIIDPTDTWTITAQPGLQNPNVLEPMGAHLLSRQPALDAASPSDPQAFAALQKFMIEQTRYFGAWYLVASDVSTSLLQSTTHVRAYADRPRLIITSVVTTQSADLQTATLKESIDLRRDAVRDLPFPGQNAHSGVVFNLARGFLDNANEVSTLPTFPPPTGGFTATSPVSTPAVFDAATAQGTPIIPLLPDNLAAVDQLDISAEAKARITSALQSGMEVFVPARAVLINGTPAIAWYEVNPSTGATTGVTEDGGRQKLRATGQNCSPRGG